MVTNETWCKKQNASHQQPRAHEIGLLHSVISFAVLAETDKDGVDAKLERKRLDRTTNNVGFLLQTFCEKIML